MEKILQGIPRVVIYIVITVEEQEHLMMLKGVLEKVRQYGIRLKGSKCKIMRSSVDYLGYRIDKKGLHPMLDKVTAITEAPKPSNVKEQRPFLGLVNYYGRFLPRLSTVTQPLNKLLQKGVLWVWSQACDDAFQRLKKILRVI